MSDAKYWKARFEYMQQRYKEMCEAHGHLRNAAAQAKQYDQTALELCDKCGWKTLIPDDCCLNCERNKFKQACIKQCEKENGHCYMGVNYD